MYIDELQMKNKASSTKVRTVVHQSCETQRETGRYKTLRAEET